ncbi:MAG: hypothetical protein EAZ27_04145 [Cytophagales bacterium]|nr:MAG: hypothetical protein EAZ27_04145 [Cytophagales bacterium]
MNKYISIILVGLFFSCRQEPKVIKPTKVDSFNNGFFILCEGTFGAGNASVSYFDKSKNQIFNDIFKSNNEFPLGDQAQSFSYFGNKIYIVVQNSQKIEVVDAFNFKLSNTIQSDLIGSPRYFVGATPTVGYVSDWQSNGVIKVNLSSGKAEQLIATGEDPEQMYLLDNQLFVCNSGYSSLNSKDSTVAIIDIISNQLISKINVGQRPEKLLKDFVGQLWVSCKGVKKYDDNGNIDPSKSSAGSFWVVNPISKMAIQKYVFSNTEFTPENMVFSNDKRWMFYTYEGSVYKSSLTTNAFVPEKILTKSAYGLAIDAENGDLIVCIEQGYTSKGKIEIYYQSSDGSYLKKEEQTVGILPNGILFRE